MEIQVKKAKQMMDVVPDSSTKQLNDSLVSKSVRRKQGNKTLVWALTGLLILAVGFGGYMYWRYRDVSSDPASAISEKNQEETDRVLTGLKKRLLIGETEAPTVARVEDPEKLKKSNAEFYKDVLKGDYLIIFPKRAIIYREENDQIINLAPIINTSELQRNAQPSADTSTSEDNKKQ